MEYEFEHACSMNVLAWMQREESISPRCSGMRTIEKEEILFAKVSRASFLAQNFKKLYKTIAPLVAVRTTLVDYFGYISILFTLDSAICGLYGISNES
jgi:hypothetical protein